MASLPPAEIAYQKEHITEDNGQGILISAYFATVMLVLGLAARLWSIKLTGRRYAPDDFVLVAATILLLGFTVSAVASCYTSGGHKHLIALDPTDLVEQQKYIYSTSIIYFMGYGMLKISVLLLYGRIFVVRWFQRLNMSVIVLNVLILIALTLTVVMSCIPTAAYWDKTINGRCIDAVKFYWVHASINVAIDVLILVLPMPVVWKLKIDLKQKIILTLLFVLGGGTCVASILRVYFYTNFNKFDPSFTFTPPTIATLVEVALGVLCANLPTTRPLFRAFVHNTPLSGIFSATRSRSFGTAKSSQVHSTIGGGDNAHHAQPHPHPHPHDNPAALALDDPKSSDGELELPSDSKSDDVYLPDWPRGTLGPERAGAAGAAATPATSNERIVYVSEPPATVAESEDVEKAAPAGPSHAI